MGGTKLVKDCGWFVTGTDTGVGKTYVTALLLAALRQTGADAVPMKPVQTGCARRNGGLVAPDLETALAAAGLKPAPREKRWMCPARFRTPCSPHLAAAREGGRIRVRDLVAAYRHLAARHASVVVEGAGGVMVPLNTHETMLDLMRALRLPVILVARAGLGTINHTLLSLAALRAAEIPLAGVVLNTTQRGESASLVTSNRATIERLGKVKVLAVLPWRAAPDVASMQKDALFTRMAENFRHAEKSGRSRAVRSRRRDAAFQDCRAWNKHRAPQTPAECSCRR
ncbi:MAG: dethiobiotin synthase [bacterium]